jgi:hypothetical protein
MMMMVRIVGGFLWSQLPKKADIGETIVRKRNLHRAKWGPLFVHPFDKCFSKSNIKFPCGNARQLILVGFEGIRIHVWKNPDRRFFQLEGCVLFEKLNHSDTNRCRRVGTKPPRPWNRTRCVVGLNS